MQSFGSTASKHLGSPIGPYTCHRSLPFRVPDAHARTVKAAAGKGGQRKNSYFSDADPDAPLRSPLDRFKDGTDISKRGGRYKSDFIWNTNWQEQFKFEEDEKRRKEEAAAQPLQPKSGFLSFNRLEQLASVEDDLSDMLRPRPRTEGQSVDAQELTPSERAKGPVFDKIKASQAETRRWQRQDKFNRVAGPRTAAPPAVTQALIQQSRDRQAAADYEAMKAESLTWSLVLCALCSAATAYFYTKDVAVSYTMGAFGGVVYLRLLHKSLESMAGGGNIASGAISNQRLLVPVILVMAFNRWNVLAVEPTGITLQLLPMLVGFFTYKAALVGRQSVMLFEEISGKRTVANRET